MAPFTRPETVLKRAEELVAVNQHTAALQSLQEMFTSKRFRSTPLASLEPIMLRFVELCVTLRKGRTAKEGLLQYKNISQNTNVQSIEVVLRRFLALAEEKVVEAKAKADALHPAGDEAAKEDGDGVEDLEASETPESILLSAVSSDQSRDRTDRAIVTPWLKFLWEAYRTVLDTLRNNARLEILYQQIATQAFQFCLTYTRKTEFRRLSELLRSHLANVAKYAHQTHSINLTDADTLQRALDTRFAQLSAAVELELWQEAFRSVEDIHQLLTMAKKAPRPAMMAGYYEKLTRIFLVAENHLFHAAAYARYYALARSTVKTDEDHQRLAGFVLLSALAVPVHAASGDDNVKATSRLSALLNLQKVPSRGALLKEALSRNVLKRVSPSLRALYSHLEVDFHPLSICSSVAPIIAEIASNEETAKYVKPLQHVILTRLFEQLAQVYETVEIGHVLDLVKPLGNFGEKEIEKFVIGACATGGLSVRVDHVKKSITFLEDVFSPRAAAIAALGDDDVPKLQATPAELVRNQLSRLAATLQASLATVKPETLDAAAEAQKAAFARAVASVEDERKAYLHRRAILARRRELAEELTARREREDSAARAARARAAAAEESKRQAEESKRREAERIRKELEQVRIDEARKLAQSLAEKSGLKVDVNDVDSLDTNKLVQLQVEHLEKEKSQLTERLRVTFKRLDHLERAFRREERPLLAADYERQQKEDRAVHQQAVAQKRADARAAHERDIATKKRLARVVPEYEAFRAELEARRGDEYRQRKEAAERKIAEEKEKKKQRILAERAAEQAAQEERERRAAEEEEHERLAEEARLAAEEERIAEEKRKVEEIEARRAKEAEEAAKRRAEREAERAKLDEIAKRQREREEEAERRQAEIRAQRQKQTGSVWSRPGAGGAAAPAASPTPRAGAGAPAPGSWREREAAKAAAAAAAAADGLSAEASPASSQPATPPPTAGAYRPPGATGAYRPPGATGGAYRPPGANGAYRAPIGSERPSPSGSPAPPAERQAPAAAAPATDDDGFQPARSAAQKWTRGASRAAGRGGDRPGW